MKDLGRCQLMRSLTWCGVLSWLGSVSPNKSRWLNVWLVHPFLASSGGLSALPFCSSSIPALLPLSGIWTNRVLGLKVIYLSTFPLRLALPAPWSAQTRPAPSCLRVSLKDDPWTCLPVSAVHNKWGMNRQLRPWGGKWSQKWRKGEIGKSFTHIKITRGHAPNSPIYLYVQQFMWKNGRHNVIINGWYTLSDLQS